MWPFSKSVTKNAVRLREVLAQVKQFVDRSEASGWTPFTPAEISADLSAAISRIERNEAIDVDRLKMLFAPTGPIQETAMSSGWSDDYLKLSSEFDALTR